jgi:5-hydroxyisourate hydrolase-like protein (transthyretin family)
MKRQILLAFTMLALAGLALSQGRQGGAGGQVTLPLPQPPGANQGQTRPNPGPPGTASLSGSVVALGSSQPIANANVELRRIDCNNFSSPPEVVSAKTDAAGRFAFQNLRAGGWCIVATIPGGAYTPAEYMQRGILGRGATIPITDGQNVTGIQLAMAPTGGIAGRVRDRDGEYLGHARVQVMESFIHEGQRRLYILQVAQTDDRGEYRFFWLPPGAYYIAVVPENTRNRSVVSVQPQPGTGGRREDVVTPVIYPRIAPNGETTEETYVTVYYPSERDPLRALPVDVQPGNTTAGIDIVLANGRARSFHVRGTAKNTVTGEPAKGAQLRLAPKEWTATVVMPTATADDEGKFDIAGVVPGSYLLLGNMTMPNPAAPPPPPPGTPPTPPQPGVPQVPPTIQLTVNQSIDVTSAAVENVQLNLVQGVTIPGRVVIEGLVAPAATAGPNAQSPQRAINISLVRDPDIVGLPAAQLRGQVTPEGTFSIANVGPGDYRVYVAPFLAPFQWGVPNIPQGLQNMYVKSVRVGPTNALTSSVRVQGGVAPGEVEVVIGPGGGFEGSATNERREPMPNVSVALVPDGALRQRADLYRTATTDVSGRFRMQGVPPGSYKAYAFEEVPPDSWQSADFMRPYETRGVAVEIRDGNPITADLQAIPRARR